MNAMNLKNNNPKGIILIIIAMSFFAIQDSLIKFIFEKSSLYEIFFGRYIVAAFLLFCFIKVTKKNVVLKTQYPILTITRVILHFMAFSAFFISLTYMPLATANALFFSSPFFFIPQLHRSTAEHSPFGSSSPLAPEVCPEGWRT